MEQEIISEVIETLNVTLQGVGKTGNTPYRRTTGQIHLVVCLPGTEEPLGSFPQAQLKLVCTSIIPASEKAG